MSKARTTLLLCTAAALLEGFDNQSIGVAAPRLAMEFGLSAANKSWIFSAAPIGLAIGAALGGRMSDRLGRKRALVVSLLLFGLFSLLTAFATGPESLFAARFLTGIGLGGALPNFIALSSEAVDPGKRVSAVTVVMAGMPFGGSVAALIALGGQLDGGWRAIFYLGGIVPMLLGLLVHRLLEDARPALPPASGPGTAPATAGAALFDDHRAPTTLLLWTGFFFTQLVLLLMLNWLPTLMLGLGYSRSQASWASVCFNLCGSLGAMLLGRLHAGRQRRFWVIFTYSGMALALATLPAVGHTFSMAALACGLAGVFIVGAQLILFALAPLYYESTIRGTGVGAAVAIGRLGSVFGPAYAGLLLAGGGTSATVLLGIVPFVIVGGAAALALTWRRQVGAI